MSSLVGKVTTPVNKNLPRSGFWPDVDMTAYRKEMRVLNSIDEEQAEWSMVEALLDVISQLDEYEAEKKALGYTTLEEVPDIEIVGIKRNELLFKQAIFCKAKSLLLEEYRDVDNARKPGNDLIEREEPNIKKLQADSFIAIRRLKGLPGVYAELV